MEDEIKLSVTSNKAEVDKGLKEFQYAVHNEYYNFSFHVIDS